MSIPVLPSSAPFSDEQRAWLNGFFAGLLGLGDAPSGGANGITADLNGGAPVADTRTSTVAEADDEDFPWHDTSIALDERLQMAQGRKPSRVLMAAMAQLDCGSCGYLCQTYAEAIATGQEKSLTKCTPGGKETSKKLKELIADYEKSGGVTQLETGGNGAAPVPALDGPAEANGHGNGNGHALRTPITITRAAPTYSRDHPFPARVLEVRPLCGAGSAKDVRAVSFDLTGSGLKYEVGDALGVYPENCADLVREMLSQLGITGDEPVVTPESRVVPARVALRLAYDVTKPSDDFLALLADAAGDEAEARELRTLSDGDWLEGRDCIDVLHRFSSARPEASELIATLSPLQPRLYSIASSQNAFPTQVHLTVGVVRYDLGERSRKGVASTFLAERIPHGEEVNATPGHSVGVFVHPSPGFRVPSDLNAPCIMVGPGTGVAPFRAFLQERRATGATGKNWLFFGDQRAQTDFLYHDELEAFLADGTLTRLETAFSRDQAEKIYVQTRMLEHGAELWRWLQEGGHFYVCGDAKRMAKDVDAALQRIACEHGQMDEGAAKAYLQDLAKQKRYCRDVY